MLHRHQPHVAPKLRNPAVAAAAGSLSGPAYPDSMARTIGSWLSGAGAQEPSPDHSPSDYPGQRLGLPQTGPRSIAGMGRRIAALFVDWMIAYGLAALAMTWIIPATGLIPWLRTASNQQIWNRSGSAGPVCLISEEIRGRVEVPLGGKLDSLGDLGQRRRGPGAEWATTSASSSSSGASGSKEANSLGGQDDFCDLQIGFELTELLQGPVHGSFSGGLVLADPVHRRLEGRTGSDRPLPGGSAR